MKHFNLLAISTIASIALLHSPIALTAPTSTTTATQGGEGKVDWTTHLWSHHHYHIQNLTGMKQVYHLTMNLCATDKGECKTYKTVLGLEHGQEISWDHELTHNVIYKVVGDHPVNASTIVENMPEVTSGDQKYVWVHY